MLYSGREKENKKGLCEFLTILLLLLKVKLKAPTVKKEMIFGKVFHFYGRYSLSHFLDSL